MLTSREQSPSLLLPHKTAQDVNSPIQIGIYNELHPLRATTTWGPVGAEAVLTQLYTQGRSLFFDEMDVPKAREEGIKYEDFLNNQGIKVVSVRDHLAKTLPTDDVNHRAVRNGIVIRAREIMNEQGYTPTSVFDGTTPEDVAMDLLERDITRYGEDHALALNQRLLLDVEMPLGNAIFARDQMNVLLSKRVVSNMQYPIRQPEVALYEQVYDSILANHQKIELPTGETFEGGDAYIFSNTLYIGVGVRTTMGAVLEIYKHLQNELEEKGIRFAIVEDISKKNQQDAIHIDTYSGPIAEKVIAVCPQEAERRLVHFVSTDKNGEMLIQDTGLNFVEHLIDEGNTVLSIPKEEQVSFGCNFLALGDGEIVLPLTTNETTNRVLENSGAEIHIIDLEQSTKGNGAAHCMSGQLARN